MHLFHITENDTRLTWMSKDNRNRSVSIKDVKNVRSRAIVYLDLPHMPPHLAVDMTVQLASAGHIRGP